MIGPLLHVARAILDHIAPPADTASAPVVDVRETCSCGASLMLEGPFDGATLAAWVDRWRKEHPCQPNDKDVTHIGAGAQTERAWTEPHRSDSEMVIRAMRSRPAGFVLYPPMGRVVTSAGEGA